VIEPSIVRAASGDGDEATGLDLALARGSEAMTAIAKVDTMLELLPVSLDARLMLERVLPIYDASGGLSAEEATSHFRSHSTAASKSALFADIPAPDSQIEQAWRDLLAFDFEERCARPSAATLLSVWQSIIDYSTLEQLDMTGDVNFKGFFQTEQASPTDALVAEAILLSLQDWSLPNSTAHSLHLDRPRVVSWVGRTLLQARSEKPGSKPLRTEDYVNQWQDLLPESQREDAELHKLPEACYAIEVGEGKGTILWRSLDDTGSGPAQTAIAGATKATSGKRKWHEKFKAQRKEIKK
jgi:sister chromatid cohesion protein DCC1